MIEVSVFQGDGYLAVQVSGHAGAGPKGADVVCAAVSAIVETAVLGLAELARHYPQHVAFMTAPVAQCDCEDCIGEDGPDETGSGTLTVEQFEEFVELVLKAERKDQ